MKFRLASLAGLVGLLVSAIPALAHHSFAAEFDGKQRIQLSGIVTKIEWTNPHVWFYVNVQEEGTGKFVNWGAEMGPPHGLQGSGWRRETLKIGDEITAKNLPDFGLEDNIVFSTDYPHLDVKYPHAVESFLKLPFSDTTKRKYLWDNCARLYNFD